MCYATLEKGLAEICTTFFVNLRTACVLIIYVNGPYVKEWYSALRTSSSHPIDRSFLDHSDNFPRQSGLGLGSRLIFQLFGREDGSRSLQPAYCLIRPAMVMVVKN